MIELTDMHCHILPYVDDGAEDMDVTLDLLKLEYEQGVRTICFTPHLRKHMFTSPDEKIRDVFSRVCAQAKEIYPDLDLFLSREYYYDDDFRKLLEKGEVIPMGDKNVLLVEFSYSSSAEKLADAVKVVRSAGYKPMFAHIERYEAIQKDINLAIALKDAGVILQLNANSILGLDGWKLKRVCKRLLKEGCANIIASDAHDPEHRTVNLRRCADHLEKKLGSGAANQLMNVGPQYILR